MDFVLNRQSSWMEYQPKINKKIQALFMLKVLLIKMYSFYIVCQVLKIIFIKTYKIQPPGLLIVASADTIFHKFLELIYILHMFQILYILQVFIYFICHKFSFYNGFMNAFCQYRQIIFNFSDKRPGFC